MVVRRYNLCKISEESTNHIFNSLCQNETIAEHAIRENLEGNVNKCERRKQRSFGWVDLTEHT